MKLEKYEFEEYITGYGIVYLASPYTHKDFEVRQKRYQQALEATTEITENFDLNIFSPIVHSHPIGIELDKSQKGLSTDRDFWLNKCLAYVEKCDELWVLMIDGYKESYGVAVEVRYALHLDKRVFFYNPEDGVVTEHDELPEGAFDFNY